MPVANVRTLAPSRNPILTMLKQNLLIGGPILALPTQEGAGATVSDISGCGNHGTITGATWVQLPSGLWVLHYNGTSHKVDIPYHDGLNQTIFSFCCWAIFDSFAAAYDMLAQQLGSWLFCTSQAGDGKGFLWLNPMCAEHHAYHHTIQSDTAVGILSTGVPYFVAFTWDSVNKDTIPTNTKVLVNGVDVTTIRLLTHVGFDIAAAIITLGRNGNNDRHVGQMWGHRYFPRLVSDAEWLEIYNREKGFMSIAGGIPVRLSQQRQLAVIR